MPVVQHFNSSLSFEDTVNDAIHVRLVAVEQVPKLVILRCRRASVWVFFQGEYSLLELYIPFQGGVRMLGLDLPVDVGKVPLRAGGNVNPVSQMFP